jgi:hypothetical protein
LRENPVFGIGPEAFRTDALTRRLPSDPGGSYRTGPHNEILRIGAETGACSGWRSTSWRRASWPVSGAGPDRRECRASTTTEQLRIRLGLALFLYGFIVNLFLAGGGLNTFFVMFPAALLFSVRLPRPAERAFLSPPLTCRRGIGVARHVARAASPSKASAYGADRET